MMLLLLAAQEGKKLATIPEGYELKGTPVFSPDGSRVACVLVKDGKRHLFLDGAVGEGFEEIEGTTFSPDSKSVAYAAASGGKRGEYDTLEGAKWRVVQDGRKGPEFECVYAGLRFLAPGNSVVYVTSVGGGDQERFSILVGEKKVLEDSTILPMIGFHPASTSFAYVAQKDGKRFTVLGERRFETHFPTWWPAVSPDGSTLAYPATHPDGAVLVVGEKPGEPFEEISDIQFSADGKHVACRAKKGEKYLVLLDGKKGPEHPIVMSVTIRPDGGAVAYTVSDGEKNWAMIDGKPGTTYASIDRFVFSPDGRRTAYPARKSDGSSVMVVDGKESEAFEEVGADHTARTLQGSAVFAGSKPAFAAKKDGRWLVVAGESRSESFDWVTDPRIVRGRIGFGSRNGNELHWHLFSE